MSQWPHIISLLCCQTQVTKIKSKGLLPIDLSVKEAFHSNNSLSYYCFTGKDRKKMLSHRIEQK